MKNRFIFLIFLVAFILQSTLASNIVIMGVSPDLLLCLVVIFAFMFKEEQAMIFGVIFGLIKDISFAEIIGISAIVYFLLALLIGTLKRYLYRDNVFSVAFIAIVGTLVYNLLYWCLVRILGSNSDFFYMLEKQPIFLVYHVILVQFLYWIMLKKVIRYRGDNYMH